MYKAYKNDVLFFKTDSASDETALTSANLNLQAGSAGSFVFTVPPDSILMSYLLRGTVVFSNGVATYTGSTGTLETDNYSISMFDGGMVYYGNDETFASPFSTDISVTNKIGTIIADENTTYSFASADDYQNLNLLYDYIDVYRDTDLIFSGRIYSIKKLFNGLIEVTCEGLLAILNDSIIRPTIYNGSLYNLVSALLTSHNDQVEPSKQISVGNLTIGNTNVYREYENFDSTISRLQDLQESFGGFLSIRKEVSGLYLDWTGYDTATTQEINFGENLLDVNVTENATSKVTRLIPLGSQQDDGTRLTIESVNSGCDYIEADADYIAKYGTVTATQEWGDVTVASNLLSKGRAYLAALLADDVTINVTAVDLADAGYNVDSFKVGNTIHVISDRHEIDNTFNCTKQTLDLLHPASNRLTLGLTIKGFVQSQNQTAKMISVLTERSVTRTAMASAIQNATDLITGVDGGFVVFNDSDGDTYPDEILIMDSDDINAAVHVWRFNKNGWGYSSNGYNGTYSLAATMDGGIVADYIATGILRGLSGNSYWNIDSGELHVDGTVVTNDITATGGTVGGFRLEADSMHTDGVAITSNASNSLGLSSSTFTRTIGGTSRSNLKFAIGPAFAVASDGSLYSSGATITGGTVSLTGSSSTDIRVQVAYSSYISKLSAYGLTATSSSFESICAHNMTAGYRIVSGNTVTAYSFLVTNNGGVGQLCNSSGTVNISMIGSTGAITCISLTQTSDRRKKENIKDLDAEKSESFIYGLKPASFRFINDEEGKTHHGFIAQDVEEIVDGDWSVVDEDESGIKTLSYTEIIADLVATVQKQNERISALEEKIAELTGGM